MLPLCFLWSARSSRNNCPENLSEFLFASSKLKQAKEQKRKGKIDLTLLLLTLSEHPISLEKELWHFSSFPQSTGSTACALTVCNWCGYKLTVSLFCPGKHLLLLCKQFSILPFISTFFERSDTQRYDLFIFIFFHTHSFCNKVTACVSLNTCIIIFTFLAGNGRQTCLWSYTSTVTRSARHSFRALETGLNPCSIWFLLGICSRDTFSCYHWFTLYK